MNISRARAIALATLVPLLATAGCSYAPEASDSSTSTSGSGILGAETATSALKLSSSTLNLVTWEPWVPLSGGLVTDPVVVTTATANGERRDVLATGPDGRVYTRWFDGTAWNPSGTNWLSLGNLGHPVGPPNAIATSNGIQVFVRDSVTHHLLQQVEVNGAWKSAWVDLGGDLAPGKPTVTNLDGIAAVFATGSDGTVQSIRVLGYDFAMAWTSLSGTATGEPGAVSWGTSRLDVVVRATNNSLWHRYSSDGGNTWLPANGAWEGLGGNIATTPSVVSWQSGELEIFATGTDATVHHMGYSSAGWTAWQTVGGGAYVDSQHGVAPVVAYSTGVGQATLFLQGTDRGLWLSNILTAPTNGQFTYGPWNELTSCFRSSGAASVAGAGSFLGIPLMDVVITAFDANDDGAVWFDSMAKLGQAASSGPPACPCGAVPVSSPGEVCCNENSCPISGTACFYSTGAVEPTCQISVNGLPYYPYDVTNVTTRYNDISFKLASQSYMTWGWKVTSGNLQAQGELPAGGGTVDVAENFVGAPYAVSPDTKYVISFYPGGLTTLSPPEGSISFLTPYDTTPQCVIDHDCPQDPGDGDDGSSCLPGDGCCADGLCGGGDQACEEADPSSSWCWAGQ